MQFNPKFTQAQSKTHSRPTVNFPIKASSTIKAISQAKMVRFSICKKPLESEIALSLMRAPPKGFPTCPVPLLGNLRYLREVETTDFEHIWSGSIAARSKTGSSSIQMGQTGQNILVSYNILRFLGFGC